MADVKYNAGVEGIDTIDTDGRWKKFLANF
jgi:hypothetical protein